MGGKTTKTKQTVKIPPEVLARYNQVNQQAQELYKTPFQKYSTDPDAFVAGINDTQREAMDWTRNFGQNFDDISGMIDQGTAGVGPLTEEDINRYMSPYLNDVVSSAMKQLDYTQGQQRSNLWGQSIMNGAFGGDRGGVAAANMQYGQDLARGSTLANLLNTGYGQALTTAQGQQQVQIDNLRRMLEGAGMLGQSTQLGLGAANQLFGQGSAEQQTEQAGKSALYNQFLQEMAFPWQKLQYVTNTAMGTGALSGSTTTTQQPAGFFSDRRLKTDIKRVGHTDDGLPIYKYKYKGDPQEQTHIGFMADEVEKRHPEAVGVAAGYKTVDYDKATKAGGGGVVPYGGDGGVYGVAPMASSGVAGKSAVSYGGDSPGELKSLPGGLRMASMMDLSGGMSRHKAGGGGVMPYGGPESGMYGGAGIGIPLERIQPGTLAVAGDIPQQRSAVEQAAQIANTASSVMDMGKTAKDYGNKAYDWFKEGQQKRDAMDLVGMYQRMNGGRVRRASGGVIPYDTGMSKIDIPDEKEEVKTLPTPDAPNKPRSGFDTVKDIIDIGMKAAPFFLADGGVVPSIDDVDTEGLGPVAAAPVVKEAAKPAVEPTYDNMLSASKHAIGSIESSDNYRSVGPVTKRKDGSVDRPYGRYQIMGSNIPQWTQEVFGKALTPEQFLSDERIQDAVFEHKFGSYLKKTGNAMDAASMWFTGRPLSAVPRGTTDVLGTSAPAYVAKFNKALGQYSPSVPEVPAEGGVAPAAITPASYETESSGEEQNGFSPMRAFGRAKDFVSDMLPSSPEGKLALLAGVFGMLASPNHFLLQAVGDGGLAGVKTYGDLIRLRNESLKNTMGIIDSRFTTVDGKTYIDRYTGQRLTREQYQATINRMMQNSGIGGVGAATGLGGAGIPGVASSTDEGGVAPTPATATTELDGGYPVVKSLVDDSKDVLAAPPAQPIPEPDSTGVAPAATSTAEPTGTTVLDPVAIQTRILNDDNRWANSPPQMNPKFLFTKADEFMSMADQKRAEAASWRQQATDAMAFNPTAAASFTSYANQANESANTYTENANKYREQGRTLLADASKIEVENLVKQNAAGFETINVLEDPGNPARSAVVARKKSDVLADIAAGKRVVITNSPSLTKIVNVPQNPNNPASPNIAITEADVLESNQNGRPRVTSFSPTETTLKDVPLNPNDPTSPLTAMSEAEILRRKMRGEPTITGFSPTETEMMDVIRDPSDVTSDKVSVPKATVVRRSRAGDPVTTEINPTKTKTVTVQKGPYEPKTVTTEAQQINAANAGQNPVVEPSPLAVKALEEVDKAERGMNEDNVLRQPLINRTNALTSIMEKYETGAWDTYKAEILGQLRAAGFDVPQDTTASVQKIVKDSVKQVYDQAKQIGNKVLVAEIEGLSKTVPGVGLQPDANRALLGQMKGLLTWEQKLYDDYTAWRHDPNNPQNLNDPYPNVWINKWAKENKLGDFVKEATKTIAPKGMSMPPVSERTINTRYNSPRGMVYWNPSTNKWSDKPVPEN